MDVPLNVASSTAVLLTTEIQRNAAKLCRDFSKRIKSLPNPLMSSKYSSRNLRTTLGLNHLKLRRK